MGMMSQGQEQHENSGITLLPAQGSALRTVVTSCCTSQMEADFVATVAAATIFLPGGEHTLVRGL